MEYKAENIGIARHSCVKASISNDVIQFEFPNISVILDRKWYYIGLQLKLPKYVVNRPESQPIFALERYYQYLKHLFLKELILMINL